MSKRNKIQIGILITTILGTVGGYFLFAKNQLKGPKEFDEQRRIAIISYLSNPSFTHPEFCEQLTGTKAKLEVNQLDEHQLYFSLEKKYFLGDQTLKKLCLIPDKVEFSKFKNGIQTLGDYRFNDTSALFFRFPDSLFNLKKKLVFSVRYGPLTYTIKDSELVNYMTTRSVYGGEMYITKNGQERELIYGLNHGAFVSDKKEPSLQRLVKKITGDCKSQEEKVQALLNFVTRSIKYSFNEAYSSHETLKRPNEVLMTGSSDCSGKTILFASFLEQIGVYYRLAYMANHIAVYVKGNFPLSNNNHIRIDGKNYFLAETTCADYIIGKSVLADESQFHLIKFIQKVGQHSVITNMSSGKKYEL